MRLAPRPGEAAAACTWIPLAWKVSTETSSSQEFMALGIHVLQEARKHRLHSVLCSASVNPGTWTSAHSSVPSLGAVTPPEFLNTETGRAATRYTKTNTRWFTAGTRIRLPRPPCGPRTQQDPASHRRQHFCVIENRSHS